MPRAVLLGTMLSLLAPVVVAVEVEVEVAPGPTGFACSAETLESGRDCALEAEPPEGADPELQHEQNVAAAAALAARLCASVARVGSERRPDAERLWSGQSCQKRFHEAVLDACGLDGGAALFDAQGRFSVRAGACYRELSAVLARTRTEAALVLPCCRCLARDCGAAATACREAVLESEVPADAAACFARGACARDCPTVRPAPAQDETSDPPPEKRTTPARTPRYTY